MGGWADKFSASLHQSRCCLLLRDDAVLTMAGCLPASWAYLSPLLYPICLHICLPVSAADSLICRLQRQLTLSSRCTMLCCCVEKCLAAIFPCDAPAHIRTPAAPHTQSDRAGTSVPPWPVSVVNCSDTSAPPLGSCSRVRLGCDGLAIAGHPVTASVATHGWVCLSASVPCG